MRFWTVQSYVSFPESSNLASLSNWNSLRQSVLARCAMFHCHRRDWPSGCKHCSRSRALDALGKETWDTMPMNAASNSTLQDASEDIWSDPWAQVFLSGDWIQARFIPPDSMMVHHPPPIVFDVRLKRCFWSVRLASVLSFEFQSQEDIYTGIVFLFKWVCLKIVCVYIYYIHITQMAILIIEIQSIIYVYI